MDLHSITLGQSVYIAQSPNPGYAKLVDVISGHPDEEDIRRYWSLEKGDKLWNSVRNSISTRFVFQREGTGTYVIIPESCKEYIVRFRGDTDA